MVAPIPAQMAHKLPPRKRQTLDGLLRGLSEKQVALELGLSKHTVHVYVKQLHAQFGVNSRGELLSLWVGSPDSGAQVSPEAPSKRMEDSELIARLVLRRARLQAQLN